MFTDAMDGTVELDVTDNGDGQHVILNVIRNVIGDTDALGIALTYEQCHELADLLHTLG